MAVIPKITPVITPIPDYEYKFCKFTVDGPVATFMWSDPPVRNAYNDRSWEGLHNAVATVKEDDDIRVLVITGDPAGKTFCGGLNVKAQAARGERGGKYEESVRHFGEEPLTPGTPEYQALERNMSWMGMGRDRVKLSDKGEGYDTYNAWRHGNRVGGFMKQRGQTIMELDKPVIAMVNGSCHGFGCDIAFYCDIIIASEERGAFEWTYIHRGMVAAEGATYFLPRIAGKHIALECLWTGRPISARQAYEWGLINHVVPHVELEPFTYDLARKLATESPPMIMGAIKWAVHKGYGDFINGLYDHLQFIVRSASNTYTGSEDAREGSRAFAEKRKPVYRFR